MLKLVNTASKNWSGVDSGNAQDPRLCSVGGEIHVGQIRVKGVWFGGVESEWRLVYRWVGQSDGCGN